MHPGGFRGLQPYARYAANFVRYREPTPFIFPSRRRGGKKLSADERRNPSLVAYVEEPPSTSVRGSSVCEFRGWVATAKATPARVNVSSEDEGRREYAADLPRPDVVERIARRYPSCTNAGGFRFVVDIAKGRRPLRVGLEFTDGDVIARSDRYRLSGVGPVQRADYKRVWNDQAEELDSAKMAVSFTTDDAENERTAKEFIPALQAAVGIHPDDVVLEIGAGIGRVGNHLAPLCKRWIGADVSENMLEHLRARLEAHPNVDTVALNGWDLAPIESESVDVVYATVVFMHLDEWERYSYIREGMRVLRPGGRMYVDNFNLLSDPGWELFQQTADAFHPLARPAHIGKSSTPQELHAYLERAGFREIEGAQDSSQMFVWVAGRKPAL